MSERRVIEVVAVANGAVVRTIDVSHIGERGRERCERGLNVNLDHTRFHTRIVVVKAEVQ